MPTIAPLQILVFRHPDDPEVDRYQRALVRAFQGGVEAGNYLATGDDLGIQLQEFSTVPPRPADQLLDAFCHTVTVVFSDQALLEKGGDPLWDWLAECWDQTRSSNGRHAMLAIAMEERFGRSYSDKRPSLGSHQLLHVRDLGETAIRPAMLALRMLHECRLRLAESLPKVAGETPGHLRLFISHAKIDGLPLAHALKHQIQTIDWLKAFYDADDLPSGSDWQKELERGVGSSLIVMLRTEVYEGRYWCKQEVLWADEYATPAVLVEARTGLDHPAGGLPFDRVPSVRIPDGNLLRILFLALREGLRFLLFKRRSEQMEVDGDLPTPHELRIFSFPPSMSALLRACRVLTDLKVPTATPCFILYPDPPLRAGNYEAAAALVAAYAPSGTRLVTPNTLAATKGATP
jgi:hypothetical protein